MKHEAATDVMLSIAEAAPDALELTLGENSIAVVVENYWATETLASFTADEAGTYTLAPAAGETNADVYLYQGDWIENYPYTFTLEAGETITFAVCSLDVMFVTEDTIELVITKIA